jgi:hypothetical protein
MDDSHLMNAYHMLKRRGWGVDHPEVLGLAVEIVRRKLRWKRRS